MIGHERLINATLPFVRDLLITYGEFFPVATAITTDGSIQPVAIYDGGECPPSDKLIAEFKKYFTASQSDYDAVAILYDVRTINPGSGIKIDAIFIETKIESSGYVYYYLYTLSEYNQYSFSNEYWKDTYSKEIFIN